MSRALNAALKTMEEVGGALVSIALVLCAVFVPTAFLSVALPDSSSSNSPSRSRWRLHLFCSLTLSPAPASQLPAEDRLAEPHRPADGFTGLFNRVLRPAVARATRVADFVIRHTAATPAGLCRAHRSAAGCSRPLRRASFRRRIAIRHHIRATAGRRVAGAHHRGGARDRAHCVGYAGHRSRGRLCRLLRRDADAVGNAAALFPVFDEPEVRLKRGLSATAITASCASACPRSRAPSSL